MRMGRLLGILVALIALMGLVFPAAGQGDNLLQNAGFDEPFVEIQPFGTVAVGWTPWFVEEGSAPASPFFGAAGEDRILIGDGAQLVSSVFATAQAGVYQTVTVPAGAAVRFSLSVYVWSSIDEADPSVSTVPGLVTTQVGIDPTGGIDPLNSAIVWSEPSELYDQYHPVFVEAAAQADVVTVFVRANISGDTYVSDVYLDDALLALSDGSGIVPTADSAVPTADMGAPTQDPASVEATLTAFAVTPVPATEETPAPTEDGAAATPEAPTEEPVATEVAATEEATVEAPTDAAPTEETTETPAETEEAPTVGPEFLSEVEYVVQSGDNFYDIAIAYGSTVEAILAANGMTEDTIIYPGDVLKVPVTVPAAATEAPTAEATPEPTAQPTAEPTAEPTVEPTPEAIMTEEPRTEEIERVVRVGDTLIAIANEYGINEFDLAEYNGFTVMDVIRVGQVIRIPAEVVSEGTGGSGEETATAEPTEEATAEATPEFRRYVIVPGDTLSRIASRFGVTVRAILEINDIPNPNRILYGQVIRIPNE